MSSFAQYTTSQRLSACFFYAFTSTSITFFNKAVLSAFNFKLPNIMTLFQMTFSLVFLITAKKLRLIAYPAFSRSVLIATLPLSISFFAMVLTGLGALQYLNIPMFNTLRRLTTLITMSGEYYLTKHSESRSVKLSVWIMILGAVIAGLADFDFSLIGYILVGLNCFTTAAYLLCIKKFGNQGLNSFGLMFYNNLSSLPIIVVMCALNGDLVAMYKYEHLRNWSFLTCFLFQSALAFLLNYSIFLCTNINSALATSVTGQIKNIGTTSVGYFLFADVTFSAINVVGLFVGVAGSVLYTWLKFAESERSKAKQSLLPSADAPKGSHSIQANSNSNSNSSTTLDGVQQVQLEMPHSTSNYAHTQINKRDMDISERQPLINGSTHQHQHSHQHHNHDTAHARMANRQS